MRHITHVILFLLLTSLAGASYAGISQSERESLVALYNSAGGANWTDNTGWMGAAGTECSWYGISCAFDSVVTRILLPNNGLFGSIPSELGNHQNLGELNLSSNALSGSIPAELGNLTTLYNLNLSNNDFSGVAPPSLSSFSIPDSAFKSEPISSVEREALVALYNSAGGANWKNNTGWMGVAGTECDWFGITCTNDSVTLISLSSNGLSGSIPSELGNLTNLTRLYLIANNLSGSIPPELGNLTKLTWLFLNSNSLSGSIPSELDNLSNLERLYLNANSLSGSIPAWLGTLSNMEWLYLNGNSFTGTIPSELSSLANLKRFSISENSLSGSIPAWLGTLINLEKLYLWGNSFVGSIPPELGNLTKLTDLNLSANSLNGSIPPGLGNLTNLTYLALNGNSLSGSIPPELGNLTNLRYLYMKENSLSGSIPPELGNLTNLLSLSLRINNLTESIPPELGNLTELIGLYLSSNNLSGGIPTELSNLSKLKVLELEGNLLTGSIPPELGDLTALETLTLASNEFSGVVPPSLSSFSVPDSAFKSESTVVADAAAKVIADKAAADKIVADAAAKVIADKAAADKIVADAAAKVIEDKAAADKIVADAAAKVIADKAAADKIVADAAASASLGATATQLGGVDPDKTGTLTSDQLGKLDASAIASFDKNQIADLDPVAVAGLSADQVKVIDTVAIGGFNKEQISKLSQSAISGLTSDQFDKIAPAVLSGLTKDNLGGLGSKVIGNITPEVLSNLNIDAVKGMATEEFSKFITNLDSTKITTDNVDGLLPSGWTLEASGQLKAPPGAKLAFKTLEKVTNINNTSLPTLPDLSKSFSLGGGGSDSVLDGLDKAIDSNNIGYKFYQRSDGILNLRAVDASLDLTPAAAFLPDTSEMKQAPKNSVPGIGVDSRGAYVLITDKGYSIPLLPALINPDAVKNLLPVTSEIEIGAGGQTTISDLGDGRGNAVAGVPNPLVSTSSKSAGIYSIGSGAKEKIEIVQADGSLQVISPAFKDQDGLITALYAIPEIVGVEINTDGTVDLIYNGSSLILKPHFDVEIKKDGGKYLAGITQDNGKFYFTNAKGERQQFN
jgi:Leucine-rich repeat (LRR) protein